MKPNGTKKPNGYQYAYNKPHACEHCGDKPKEGGRGKQYRLFEVNGEKFCRECAKASGII